MTNEPGAESNPQFAEDAEKTLQLSPEIRARITEFQKAIQEKGETDEVLDMFQDFNPDALCLVQGMGGRYCDIEVARWNEPGNIIGSMRLLAPARAAREELPSKDDFWFQIEKIYEEEYIIIEEKYSYSQRELVITPEVDRQKDRKWKRNTQARGIIYKDSLESLGWRKAS